MNWEQIAGNWGQVRGKAKQQWGKLTDSDLDQIEGKRDVLISRLQQRYGIPRDEALNKVEEWLATLNQGAQTTQPAAHQTAKG